MYRAASLVVLVGCGFQVAGTPGDGVAGGDAAVGDATPGDGPGPDGAPPTPDAPPDAPAPRVCGAAYVAVPAASTMSTYRKNNTGAGWTAARSSCQADGADLIIPETPAEATAVFAFVAPASNSPYYWIGVADPENDGSWTTVLGQLVAFPPWGPMQPTNAGGDDSVLAGSTGRWYDWGSGAPQEFACECPP